MIKYTRIIALLLGISLLGACSNTFVYNQLDWLIPWYVDDYVDLTRDQKKSLKAQLQPLLRWHRSEELAGYIRILDDIETDLAGPLSGEQIEAWANELVGAWERIEERMLPVVFELGADLSDSQMQEFIDTLWERQEELEEEYLPRTEEEYIEESFESFEENLRELMGRLSPEQVALLRDASVSLQRFDGVWLEDRRAWLGRLEQLLQREPGWEQATLAAIEEHENNPSPAYSEAYSHNREIINNTIAEVLNLRSEKQSARLQREIADIRRDLGKLIAQAEDQAGES
jgi:hypothetical protein